ncbi:MAG: hypothetical protein CM1200mP4_2380 [Rhodospirillaceae bacterium]|nr:MAG: hypothetical protein CM1200mP4_2380 [Rhodospirillaceae bacterium]
MDAIESYNGSLSAQPNDKETLYLLGNTLLDVGHIEKDLNISGKPEALLSLA